MWWFYVLCFITWGYMALLGTTYFRAHNEYRRAKLMRALDKWEEADKCELKGWKLDQRAQKWDILLRIMK